MNASISPKNNQLMYIDMEWAFEEARNRNTIAHLDAINNAQFSGGGYALDQAIRDAQDDMSIPADELWIIERIAQEAQY